MGYDINNFDWKDETMKKKFMAMLLGTLVLLNTFGTDFVSFAEGDVESVDVVDSADEESVEIESADSIETKDEPESVEENEEVAESGEEINEETTEEITEASEEAKEVVDASEEVIEAVEETVALEETEEEAEKSEVSFEQSKTINGVQVTLTAAEGVLPEGAYFNVTELIDSNTVSSIENAVEKKLSDSQEITKVRAFDITIKDAEGNEIQPDSSKGNVTVSFSNIDTSEAKSNDSVDMDVYHVTDDATSASDMGATVGNGEVSFDTEHFSTYAVVSIEDNEADPTKEINENDLIKSVTVSKVDSNGNVTALTSDGDNVISKDDTIRVKYVFNDMSIVLSGDEKYAAYNYVYPGKSYKIPGIPSECVRSDNADITVTNGTTTLGIISFDSDGNAVLKIADFTETIESVTNATAGFDLKLDISSDGSNAKSSYDLSFGGTTITVNVDEYMAKAPTVTKTASEPDANGVVTWTVTLKNNSNPIEYVKGYSFTDTFGSGQDYVAGSFTVNGTKSDIATNDGSTLTWTYKDNTASATNTFTYQTKIDVIAKTSSINESKEISESVSNKIVVTAPATDDYDALNISDSASSTFTQTMVKWIDKEGGQVDSNGVASWTVTIQNNGFDLYDVVLTDKVIADTGVTISISDISVVNGNGDTVTYDYSYSDNTQKFEFGEMSGNAKYVVTYKTTIENFDTYTKENHSIPKNQATISYKYKNGNGEYVSAPTPPTVGKSFVNETLLVTNAAIQKEAGGYDATNHTIKWNVTVNKSKQSLTNVKVADILPTDNEYVSISDVKLGDTELRTTDYSIDESTSGKVVFDFSNSSVAINDILTFTVTTRLTNESVWASNATKSYTNKVNLHYGDTDAVKATHSATQSCTSNVIKKTAGTYNYASRTIPYTLVVDTNEMPMDGVKVTDVLDSRLEYVDGSATGATVDYDTSTNTLTFNLGSITGKLTITFMAKVKDGETFKNTGDVTISNTASLVSTQYATATTSSDTTEFTNTVIAKAGSQNEEVIDYTVSLNPAQQTLYADDIDEVVIQDTLGASLSLDEDSVHLYEATVAATGTLTANAEITDVTVRVNTVDGKTVLEVVVPKEYDGKAFVLKYTAYMLNKDAGDFTNDVKLVGYGSQETNNAVVSYTQSDFSSVDFTKYTYYFAELRDDYDRTILLKEGHFKLVDLEGKVVAEADIDSDGEIIFKGPSIQPNTEYKIIQTTAPEGYIIPDEYQTGKSVTTGEKGLTAARKQKENNTLYNAKPKKEISILKQDGLNNYVVDAGLEITWVNSDSTAESAAAWTTGNSSYEFTASEDIAYTLAETTTPFGYNTANNIVFKVENDQLYQRNTDNTWAAVDSILMIDSIKDTISFTVSKISDGQGNDLIGAELILSEESDADAAKDNNISSWTTDGSAKEFALPAGDYYLHEIVAPAGYDVTDSIHIVITTDGEIEVDDQVIDDAKITMVDSYKTKTITDDNGDEIEVPDSTTTFTISPDILGIDPTIFEEMKFTLFTLDPIAGKLVEVTPTTVDEDTLESVYDLKYQEEYILKPTAEIEGYDPVDPITIKIVGITNEDGEVETSLLTKPMGSTVFTNSTITELGKNVTPKLTPVIVPEEPTTEVTDPVDTPTEEPSEAPVKEATESSSSTNGSHHSHYGAAPTTDVADEDLTIKEHEIVALTDDQDSAPTLAKTGGFIGTLIAYLAAVILIACGLFLVFGKEKRVK